MTSSPFAKLLIANRGEIAVRIARTCKEMGISTVAIYSTADARALHVQVADEAFCVGPEPALESYLSIDAILAVARESGADAVHPGYGFLAENPDFARAVHSAGLTWIGPPAEVIAVMGDKVAAKELARSAGVPIVPGYDGVDQTTERFLAEAERVGYPVMLKAVAGGGGKGMRAVLASEELPAALEGAKREARSSFGDDRMFIEKLLSDPRHIEIQIMVDSYGHAIYLGERDCSIQRRHQKVVEEAPSPVITPEIRSEMGDAALRLARAGGYRNAGTVEFLFSADSYYFLEMNTRIQVEHPVTEMITGLDLVRLQLEIAGNQLLSLGQADVHLDGHAIEARIYAEDPYGGFLPSSGPVRVFRPPEGPGVRNDVGVYSGSVVTPYYDPLLAKLIVRAATRPQAVERLRAALSRYEVEGIITNLPFLRWLSAAPRFAAGQIDVGFVDAEWRPGSRPAAPFEVLVTAAMYDVTAGRAPGEGGAATGVHSPWEAPDGWRFAGIPRVLTYSAGDVRHRMELERAAPGLWDIRSGDTGGRFVVLSRRPDALVLQEEHRVVRAEIEPRPEGLAVRLDGETFTLTRSSLSAAGGRSPAGSLDSAVPVAPMPGTVVKIAVQEGEIVAPHQPLVVLEAMKMEHVVEAPYGGRVVAVLVREGDLLAAGAPVVDMEPV